MVRLDLVSVGFVQENGSVVMVLRAPEQQRLLIMDIGTFEGRAIHMAAEGIDPARPLTHDLLASVVAALNARVDRVEIKELKDGVFYAHLLIHAPNGDEVVLDCRPSDAVALALRVGAPIYAESAVLTEAGIDEDESIFADDDGGEADQDEPPIH